MVQGSLTFVSRIFGFARDILIAAVLGAGAVSDVWNAALAFPNMFRRVFAEGAFAQAFVPFYTRRLREEGEGPAHTLASGTLAFLLVLVAGLTIALQLGMPWINLLLNKGYVDHPIFDFSTLLIQITMPYLVCMAIAALCAGVLNAIGRFALAAFAPTLLNLCLLVAILPFAQNPAAATEAQMRDAALALSVAVTVAGVIQAGLLLWGVRRAGVKLRLALPRLTPDVKAILLLAIPGTIAGSATQINFMVSQSLVSEEEGARSFLFAADRLYQLPLGMVGVAVGLALLPRLARAISDADQPRVRGSMDEALTISMAFTLPAAAAFLVMPYFLMLGFWTRGQFTAEDARMTADALIHYAWGVPAFVLAKVLAPAFFARGDTFKPMIYALVTVAINVALGVALFHWLRAQGMMGFVGFAIATSAAAWMNVIMLAVPLVASGDLRPAARTWGKLARILAAVGVMAGFVGWCALEREALIALVAGWPVVGGLAKEIAVLAVCLGGALVYALAALVTRALTLSEVRSTLRREKGAPAADTGFD